MDRERLERALVAADAAGDTRAATLFAQELRKLEQPKAPKRGLGQELGRQLGLAGRYAIEGGLGLAGTLANTPAYIANKGLEAIGADYRFPDQNLLISQALTNAGLPQPEGRLEEAVGNVSRGIAGAGGGVGLARQVAAAPTQVTSQVGQTMAQQPLTQLISGATGPAASETAKEMGAGPVGQFVAGLGGVMTPSAASAAGPGLVRGAFRGGEQGRQQMAQTIQDFADAGTTPSVGQATRRRVFRAAETGLANAPGSGGVMARKAAQQGDEMAAAIERRAATLARKTSGEQTGRAIEKAVRGDGGFIDRFKSEQRRLYDALDQFVPGDKRVSVDHTKKALAELNAEIDGARNVSQLFINSRIRGIENALKADLATPTDEAIALQQAQGQVGALERSRAQAMQEAGKFQAFAQTQKNLADEFTPVAGQPRFPGRYSPHPERSAEGAQAAEEALSIAKRRVSELDAMKARVAELEEIAASTDGRLPFEAIKKLRTLVGNEISDSTIASDVPRSKWKALYAALSDDMGEAVAGSKQGTEAWRRANRYTRAGLNRIESIESVIDKAGGPEAIFRAATSNTRDGATTLRAVMQSLDKDGQKTVSATVLRRLGIANPSNQDDLGEQFSTSTFLTNWNKLSPEAKRTLFDRYGPRFREDMNQIAKVAANLREGSEVFRNPSGTARQQALWSTTGGFVLSVLTGRVDVAAGIAAGVGGANLTARLMTNPRFVRWLAQSTRHPTAHTPSLINQLAQEARKTGDADLAEAVALLNNAQNQQQ